MQNQLGRVVLVEPVVFLRVNQRQRHFGHPGRLAVASAGEDHVFHARAAQGLGRLLAEHPGNSVGNIRLAAAIGADDCGHAVSVKLEFGAIAKRLESENLELFQFEQLTLLGLLVPRRSEYLIGRRLGCCRFTNQVPPAVR